MSVPERIVRRISATDAVRVKAWISDNQRRIVIIFRFHRPAETHRMRCCGIAITITTLAFLISLAVVGHRTATKCWSKELATVGPCQERALWLSTASIPRTAQTSASAYPFSLLAAGRTASR